MLYCEWFDGLRQPQVRVEFELANVVLVTYVVSFRLRMK